VDRVTLTALNAARRERRAAILVTHLASGAVRLFREDDADRQDRAGPELAALLEERFRSARSGLVQTAAGEEYFLTVQVPPPRPGSPGSTSPSSTRARHSRRPSASPAVIFWPNGLRMSWRAASLTRSRPLRR
jgi:hypothetical protein